MASRAGIRTPAATSGTPTPASQVGELDAWSGVAALGATLFLVGWSDVMIGLFPFRPGNPDWEFGTMSATVDALPLGTLGVGLLAAAFATRGRRLGLHAVAAFAWLAVAGLLAGALLYALSAPEVWRATPPAVHAAIRLAVFKFSLMAAIYLAFYGWLGVHCHRAARRVRFY